MDAHVGALDRRLAERIDVIAADESHGASWLAKQAVEALVEAVEAGADPLETGRRLVESRPSIGAVAGALGRVVGCSSIPGRIVEEGRALIAERERAPKAIAVLLQEELRGVVMTHSASATVREALLHSPPDRVVCTASEPIGEGRRLDRELREAGVVSELVDDADAAHAVATVDLLLLGADTVFRDGALANKVGTFALAQAAHRAGIRVAVAAEVIKLAPVDGHDPEESRFDLTPPELVDLYVTEEGAFAPDEIATLADRTPFLLDGYRLLTER